MTMIIFGSTLKISTWKNNIHLKFKTIDYLI
jgi:hypothetical protein